MPERTVGELYDDIIDNGPQTIVFAGEHWRISVPEAALQERERQRREQREVPDA